MKVGEFRPLQNPVRTLTFFVILPGEGFLDLVADQGKSDLEPLAVAQSDAWHGKTTSRKALSQP